MTFLVVFAFRTLTVKNRNLLLIIYGLKQDVKSKFLCFFGLQGTNELLVLGWRFATEVIHYTATLSENVRCVLFFGECAQLNYIEIKNLLK